MGWGQTNSATKGGGVESMDRRRLWKRAANLPAALWCRRHKACAFLGGKDTLASICKGVPRRRFTQKIRNSLQLYDDRQRRLFVVTAVRRWQTTIYRKHFMLDFPPKITLSKSKQITQKRVYLAQEPSEMNEFSKKSNTVTG